MSRAIHLFKDFLISREEKVITNILNSIDENQPEAFSKVTNQTKFNLYKEQITELIHLLERFLIGESDDEKINDWGKRVSEDNVRLGLSLSQSVHHFNSVRGALWEEISAMAERTNNFSAGESLRLGKLINDFIDDLILTFTYSFTGQATKRLRAQQEVIDELSTPVISIVDEVAVLPIIGDIDTHRARILMEHTLRETKNKEVDCLIIDLSGVFIVDTMVAQELFKIIDSLKLTGVDVNLTGMRPELAQSVVTLGINFDNVKMYSNLGQALKAFGIVRK
ncbi:STAS domain-containing protein [Mesobacillus boroniphilus]|uniref:STAS domain-containing protein n=1 Tax=Mesobacillus boroniphilus TaxID=308892 RepID=A0A944GW14_9BACI|nr:STAS domain-containing protein [Mesobacillus boroniphilus]MBS8264159.1 STAS domain-containing protein [Mesobacillus boroniphilus]